MTATTDRVNTPISTAELERRWSTVRRAMEAENVDVLVMQTATGRFGGYVRYLSDIASYGDTEITLIFPREDEMTVVRHGPFGGDTRVGSDGAPQYRGVNRVLSAPYFHSIGYTADYDANLTLEALRPYVNATIGIAGPHQLAATTLTTLGKEHATDRFIDFSDVLDTIKVAKSEEEWNLIRRTAALQDAAMERGLAAVGPGVRDYQVSAAVQQAAAQLGSDAGTYLCASAPRGMPIPLAGPQLQNRTIGDGDQVMILVETNGPGGQFTHLGRMCTVGSAPQGLLDEFAFVLEAQRFTLGLLKSGVACAEVWDEYNAFMRANGRPEERRLHCHGQGYDLVERPLIRSDETMHLTAESNLGCHPFYDKDGATHYICDNYRLGADGTVERLHSFPQTIVEL